MVNDTGALAPGGEGGKNLGQLGKNLHPLRAAPGMGRGRGRGDLGISNLR